MDIETRIAGHYTHGSLDAAIRDGLSRMGRDPDGFTLEDLAGIEEFHMGGRAATEEIAAQLELAEDAAVLDIGSGIGGAARFLAERHGCRVTGVDLTPEYVDVARALSEALGLADRVSFMTGSATDLPVDDGTFDAATLLHVGMNVPDKRALAAEAARALRPGGTFVVYDVMRTGDQDPDYPVAWSAVPETSFLETPEAYRAALEAAGFSIAAERDRRDFAIDFFARMRARVAESGPPPLGLHVLMGAEAPTKVANMVAALEAGRIAPVEIVARRA